MKQKLLVLDDEPLILSSLQHLFEDDYEVFTASEAGMAMELARVHAMAVILCDERMPGVSGHEFLGQVKEFSAATRIMMSGYADMSALAAAVNSGQIFAYVDKPWEPLDLQAQVRAAVVHFKLVQEIEQERGLLRALMDNIPDPIYFKDRQRRFLRVNQAHARALGVKDPAECVERGDSDYFEVEDALRWREQEQEIISSGQPQADRVESFKNPQGDLCWMSTTKVPMFDRAGQVSGIASIATDITALKKSEELIKLLQAVTVSANRSSNIQHTARTCLHLICSHTGWPVGHVYLHVKDSAEEKAWEGIWHGVEGNDQFTVFREATERAGLVRGSGLAGRVLASGQPQWIAGETSRAAVDAGLPLGFGFPVLLEEKIVAVVEFFSPQMAEPNEEFLTMMGHVGVQLGQVILRQRAEENLRRAKTSAESANRAKSEFLSTMSHEMRTPMNALLGMADLLAESSLGEEQRRYVDIFQKAGANLLVLINDILDLSKVESGHVELESIGFELRGFLERTIEMMLPRAKDRGLELSLEILPGVPSGLIGDPNRLQQILVNLLGNALKFTEKGSVKVRVEADPGGVPGWLRFNVVDTGIGIAADKTKIIFDRFTQADSSTTRKYGGTGLGLAISKGLAEVMGGRLGCSSEEGKGSTFYLAAPFESRPEPVVLKSPELNVPEVFASRAEVPLTPHGTGRRRPRTRILIVEDSEYNTVLIQAYLKDGDFELDVAENGKIAVEKTISGKPQLVLMDLQMPVMGGLEATRAIREWEAQTGTRPIPILALTATASDEGALSSRNAGCTEHLTKPIKKATLLEAIARHAGGKVRITPPDGIEALVPHYLEKVRRDMDQILAGVDSKDFIDARRLGHQFKGTGEGYGFPEITRAGAAVESAAKAADEDEIRNQILALAAYLDRVEVAV